MNITLPRKELLPALKIVASVIEDRGVLPILGNILLRKEDDLLKFTGSDGEIEVNYNLAVPNADCDDFALAVSKKLLVIANSLPAQSELQLTSDNDKLVIHSLKSRFTIATLPSDDYPATVNLNADSEDRSFTLAQAEFKNLLKNCVFCAAVNDVRYYLNGLLLEIKDNTLYLTSTDGHRLASVKSDLPTKTTDKATTEVPKPKKRSKKPKTEPDSVATVTEGDTIDEPSMSVIIPRKTILELFKLLSSESGDVKISYDKSRIKFTINESLQLTSKLIDGVFPDWRSVIPTESVNIVTANTADLTTALSRVSLLSNEKYKGVRLVLSENLLTLNAKNPSQEEATEDLTVDYDGEPIEIGFNCTYLLDVLAAVDTEKVKLAFTNSESSVILTQDGIEDSQWVIMPMRL